MYARPNLLVADGVHIFLPADDERTVILDISLEPI